jgi:homoserine kinase
MKYGRRYAKAFAPATVSNVGPGFDIFGFPIVGLGDYVEAFVTEGRGVTIREIKGSAADLPLEAGKNTAGKAAITLLNAVEAAFGVEIVLHKNMPIGSGLGSSAAGAVAASLAVNHLLERPLTKAELLEHALEGESVSSGSTKHGDNVFPSLLGGFTIVSHIEPPRHISVPCPDNLFCAVIHPHIQIATSYARSILPKEIGISVAVRQAANASSLIAGLFLNDDQHIRNSLMDFFAEPYRAKLIPGYEEMKGAALAAGALGAGISGSGPSVFALCRGKKRAEAAANAMKDALITCGAAGDIFVSAINRDGAQIVAAE